MIFIGNIFIIILNIIYFSKLSINHLEMHSKFSNVYVVYVCVHLHVLFLLLISNLNFIIVNQHYLYHIGSLIYLMLPFNLAWSNSFKCFMWTWKNVYFLSVLYTHMYVINFSVRSFKILTNILSLSLIKVYWILSPWF